MTALLSDEAVWDNLKAQGRQFVETERNWAASVARYREVYGRLLKTAQGETLG